MKPDLSINNTIKRTYFLRKCKIVALDTLLMPISLPIDIISCIGEGIYNYGYETYQLWNKTPYCCLNLMLMDFNLAKNKAILEGQSEFFVYLRWDYKKFDIDMFYKITRDNGYVEGPVVAEHVSFKI